MPDRRFDWFLIVLAIAVRAAAVLVLQSHTVPHSTYEHGEIAANLLAGRGFSVRFLGADGPTSQQAPLYPVLVAAAYAVGGVGTPRALLILELGQAALGGLLVAAVLRLAREVAPERPRVRRLGRADRGAAPDAGLRGDARPGRPAGRDPADGDPGLGLSRGPDGSRSRRGGDGPAARGAGADRPDPGAGRRRGRLGDRAGPRACGGRVRPLAIVALASALGVAPWIARNSRVHGEFVGIKSTFGYAFWQGNCALSEGTDKVVRASVERALTRARGRGAPRAEPALWDARHEAGYIDDIALTPADYRELALGLRARAVAPALPPGPGGPPGRARPLCPALPAAACATSSSSTRRTPRPGTSSTGRATWP